MRLLYMIDLRDIGIMHELICLICGMNKLTPPMLLSRPQSQR